MTLPAWEVIAMLLLPWVALTGVVIWLRRPNRTASVIEQQLAEISRSDLTQPIELHPLLDATAVAAGWNRLREQVGRQIDLQELRAALSRPVSGDSFRTTLEFLPDGTVQTDGAGQITYFNPAAMALLERNSKPLQTGQSLYSVFEGCFTNFAVTAVEKFRGPLPRVVADLQRGEATADGVVRVCRVRAGADGFVWTLRDVTQQKLAEQARNQFVVTATHELRTPLTNIRALAEMISLEEDLNIEEQKRFCNIINSEATRLGRFIDELLDLNSLEAGAMRINRSETDLSRLLDDVVAHVRPEAERKSISLETQLPGKLPKVPLDKDKFTGAIVNLLGNAVKYTPPGGRVRLHVETDGESLKFHVEDSGIGIAPEELPKVFEKFYRSEDPRVRENSGSGLGLAFTQEVAHAHGGRVTVTSELSKGSRFTLQLPTSSAQELTHV